MYFKKEFWKHAKQKKIYNLKNETWKWNLKFKNENVKTWNINFEKKNVFDIKNKHIFLKKKEI